jgi:hypothetical protein
MKPRKHVRSESPAALAKRIRRLAKKDDLIAQKSRKDSKWYFADLSNCLNSPERGLDDREAVRFLGEEQQHD